MPRVYYTNYGCEFIGFPIEDEPSLLDIRIRLIICNGGHPIPTYGLGKLESSTGRAPARCSPTVRLTVTVPLQEARKL